MLITPCPWVLFLFAFLQLVEVCHQAVNVYTVHLSTLLNTLKESSASANTAQSVSGKDP